MLSPTDDVVVVEVLRTEDKGGVEKEGEVVAVRAQVKFPVTVVVSTAQPSRHAVWHGATCVLVRVRPHVGLWVGMAVVRSTMQAGSIHGSVNAGQCGFVTVMLAV